MNRRQVLQRSPWRNPTLGSRDEKGRGLVDDVEPAQADQWTTSLVYVFGMPGSGSLFPEGVLPHLELPMLMVGCRKVGESMRQKGACPALLTENATSLKLRGHKAVCPLRYDARGQVTRVCSANADYMELPGLSIEPRGNTAYVETDLSGTKPQVVAGDPSAVESITRK